MSKQYHSLADVDPKDVLTPEIAARLIHRKAGYIRARIREKELKAVDRGGWLIKGEDFLQWLGWCEPIIDLANLEQPAQNTLADNGASMSRKRDAARMASLSQQNAIG